MCKESEVLQILTMLENYWMRIKFLSFNIVADETLFIIEEEDAIIMHYDLGKFLILFPQVLHCFKFVQFSTNFLSGNKNFILELRSFSMVLILDQSVINVPNRKSQT